jgi:hypothetical protein
MEASEASEAFFDVTNSTLEAYGVEHSEQQGAEDSEGLGNLRWSMLVEGSRRQIEVEVRVVLRRF